MSNQETFKIAYSGPALDSHQMNVKDLAPALLAVGEFFENANAILNGEQAAVVVNIQATREGSVQVVLTLAQDLITQATSLFNGEEVNAISNAAGLLSLLGVGAKGGEGLIGLIKWMNGRGVKSITKIEIDGAKIELEDGDVRVVSNKEIRLFQFLNIRKNLEAIIAIPLKKDGIESVVFENGTSREEVTKEEGRYFESPEVVEEVIDEREIESNLQIVNVSFQDAGKWRFSDGASLFYADIKDEAFIEKVGKNETYFAKEDVLKVKLRRKQSILAGRITTEYTIIEVLDHRSAAIQIKLPFENNDGKNK